MQVLLIIIELVAGHWETQVELYRYLDAGQDVHWLADIVQFWQVAEHWVQTFVTRLP